MTIPSDRPPVTRILALVVRWLVLAWAGFWAWFVVAVSIGEPPPPPWWIPTAWLAGLTVLRLLCWKRPLLGGLVLVGAGVWAAAAFDDPGARALLAAPAIVLGLACLAIRASARGVASAALVCFCLTLLACFTPQDPADLPYRT